MINGTIDSVLAIGTGWIRPAGAGALVFFTAAVFQGSWEQAVPGRAVQFTLAPNGQSATSVVPL